MNAYRRSFIKLSVITALSLSLGGCHSRNDTNDILTVSLYPDESITDHASRALVVEFNKPIDPRTLDGNIYLHDKTGSLIEMHTVKLDPDDLSHKKVILEFKSDFYLNESWKYTIFINRNVRSILGRSLPNTVSLEVYTSSRSPFDAAENGSEGGNRSKIIVISDIHMNEQRGF